MKLASGSRAREAVQVDLSPRARERIREAKLKAEEAFRAELNKLPRGSDSEELPVWLPLLETYALTLFDTHAAEYLEAGRWKTKERWRSFLEYELLPEILEPIIPDRSLEAVSQQYRYPTPEWWEFAYAPHGDLERLLCRTGFRAKFFPDEKRGFKDWLTRQLGRQITYWVVRFAGLQRRDTKRHCLVDLSELARDRDWEDIKLYVLSEHRVQVWIGDETRVLNYEELGFGDRRGRNATKPTRAWHVLLGLARHKGLLPEEASRQTVLQKRIQEIRGRLRQAFGLTGDPIPFIKGQGYRTRFTIALREPD